MKPYIFSFSKILVTFAILDNAFGSIPFSKMWLWLLMGHKTYYLISTHGKKGINEGSCMPRMNLIVYISAKTCIVTLWSSGIEGRYLEGSRSGIIFLHGELPPWEPARKHAIIMLYGAWGVGGRPFTFSLKYRVVSLCKYLIWNISKGWHLVLNDCSSQIIRKNIFSKYSLTINSMWPFLCLKL